MTLGMAYGELGPAGGPGNRGIVTAEEATVGGALGGAVAETVVQNHPTKIKILGVPEFAPTGSAGFLLDRYGMSPEGIAETARALII
jgi:transketolase